MQNEQLPFSPSRSSLPGEGSRNRQDPSTFKDSMSPEKPVTLFDLKVCLSGVSPRSSTECHLTKRTLRCLGLSFLRHFLVHRECEDGLPTTVLPTQASFFGWVRAVHIPQSLLRADLINHCDCINRREFSEEAKM